MGRRRDVHEGVAGVAGTGCCETGSLAKDDQGAPDAHLDPLPLIEITDKDYRSFCWPCHALEEG
jgi:hypothetical protein